jgi:hypothetical protein
MISNSVVVWLAKVPIAELSNFEASSIHCSSVFRAPGIFFCAISIAFGDPRQS